MCMYVCCAVYTGHCFVVISLKMMNLKNFNYKKQNLLKVCNLNVSLLSGFALMNFLLYLSHIFCILCCIFTCSIMSL